MIAGALALRFLLELGALAAFGSWGVQDIWLLAVVGPLAGAAAWGTFAAPRSRFRLRGGPYVAFEIGSFAFATAGLAIAGPARLAAVYGAVTAADAGLLHSVGAEGADATDSRRSSDGAN